MLNYSTSLNKLIKIANVVKIVAEQGEQTPEHADRNRQHHGEFMGKCNKQGKPATGTGVLNMKRLTPALRYSWAGLKAAVAHEAAFKQELLLAAVLIPVAILVRLPVIWKVMMIGAVLLVLIIELLNSGLEAIVDKVSPEYHELAKRAKDMGSAAVLLGLLNLLIIWLTAFFG